MKKTILDKRYYTVSDLIKELPLTKLSVRNYIKAGKIKAIKIGTRYFVSKENLEAFLEGPGQEVEGIAKSKV